MEQKYDELYHYGILGMKWGIRRYQNEDGSLTAAGRKHYGSDSSFGSRKRIKRARDAAQISAKIKKYKYRKSKEEKVKKLTEYHKALIKDLDDKEIKYGENWLKIKSAKKYARRDAYASGFVSRISGADGATIRSNRRQTFVVERRRLRRALGDEIAENKYLSREFKNARKEQKKSKKGK